MTGLYGQPYGYAPSGTASLQVGIRSPGQMVLDTVARLPVVENDEPALLPAEAPKTSPWLLAAGVVATVAVVGGGIYLLTRRGKGKKA